MIAMYTSIQEKNFNCINMMIKMLLESKRVLYNYEQDK